MQSWSEVYGSAVSAVLPNWSIFSYQKGDTKLQFYIQIKNKLSFKMVE